MLMLHLGGKISATDCTTSMWWAAKAGVQEASAYAMSPTSQSGHCSRKLKDALGYSGSPDLYEFEVPGHQKHQLSRTRHTVWCMPFHEQLASDLNESTGWRTKLLELRRDRALPPVYWDHPVVVKYPDRLVLPIAIYLDAVPFTQNDSVLGWWVVNLVTSARFLWGVMQKSHVCSCGCRGWCSFYVFFQVASWSLRACADAVMPSARHDGSLWGKTDSKRKDLSGVELTVPIACLYIKGDWSEFSSTLGLPTWQSGSRPCFLCNASGIDMYTAPGNNEDSLRWDENGPADYKDSCRRCVRPVTVPDQAAKSDIFRHLRYDKRQSGSRGQALMSGLSHLGLEPGDRLEPSPVLPDVGDFEQLPTPCTITFWRPSAENISRHDNPMMQEEFGLEPTRALTIDALHALNLGVIKIWCRVAVWLVLTSGIYGDVGTAEESLRIAVLAFRAALLSWYKTRHSARPSEKLTRVNDFTVKMIGTRNEPTLKTKGAETYGVLLFLLELMTIYTWRLGEHWQRLHRAGQDLVDIVSIWQGNSESWIIPAAKRQATKANVQEV